jgi:aminopeptidase N
MFRIARRRTRTVTTAAIITLVFLLGLGSLLIPLRAGAAGDTPAPQNTSDAPEVPRETLLEHRIQEAESKARFWSEMAEVEAAKTANQDQFDVRSYGLDLTLNPTTHQLTGTVTTTAEVTGTAIATLDLNLDGGLAVSGATSGGAPTTYSHVGALLTVSLDRTYNPGETVVVAVSYSGDPSGGSFGWSTYSGQPMIWTLSEPYGAREWWPCKDLNSDKADTVDILVTVPDNLVVASNGKLISNVDNGSTRTFHWRSGYPIATYLVSLAIHPYTTFSDWYTPLGGGDPMEVQFFVYPDHYSSVQATYALTVPMIEVFAQGFGEYPFLDEKYGHAEFTWGGGMEHQTCTSLGGWSEDLISHELAHQWWGDLITCADFHHIWLNEGFATWCEAYWKEQTAGFGTYQAYMDAAAYYGAGTIYVEDPSSFGAIFDSNLSYNKGSWIVHMLRGVMGDTDFFAGLALYRSTYGYGSATTEQFRDVMETASGLDLDAFFDQWIYGEYFPVYSYGWSLGAGGTIIDLTIDQVQTNAGLFTMPIDMRITTTTGTFDHVVQNSLASESYQLPVTGEVLAVTLDPDRWILRQVQTAVTDPTFAGGILLVNGVDWGTYGTEITTAYEDSAYWGENPITFWDTFSEPAGGYPANLPEPLGHGSVPGGILGFYSTLIWVGNDYNGDLPKWQETPILSYLEAGGNVLLMTRRGSQFLDTDLLTYLGVTWSNTNANLGNCVSAYPGLVDMPLTGTQSYSDVFYTSVGARSTLLLKDTVGFSGERGIGVHAQPAGGGTHRPEGGRFVYIAGRPYRYNHAALRANVEFILSSLFEEPYTPPTDVPAVTEAKRLALWPNYPNPFNPQTVIPFELPAPGRVELAIYDAAGRLVRTLLNEARRAGSLSVAWDGADQTGRLVASGTYFARLRFAGDSIVRPLVLVR